MSTQVQQIPGCEPAAMKLSHSNESIVTAVEDEQTMTMTRYEIGKGYPQTNPKQPVLAELGIYLDKLFRLHYSKLLNKGARPLKIVTILGSLDDGCVAYAKSLEKSCRDLGVEIENHVLMSANFDNAKNVIGNINGKKDVDGLIVFTPIFGGKLDEELRACIAPQLDIEALSPTSTALYENATPVPFHRVFNPYPMITIKVNEPIAKELEEFTSGKQDWKGDNVLFPCTPMGVVQIIMSVGYFWDHYANKEDALKGKVITVLNRSAVFGHPIAWMLANAGAIVYSMDVNDILLFSRPYNKVITTEVEMSTHDVKHQTDVKAELLRSADLIISAIPGDYKIKNTKLRFGCGLINVATGDNFCQEMIDQAGWYVHRVGAVTRRCLLINALIARLARESGVAVDGQGTRHEER